MIKGMFISPRSRVDGSDRFDNQCENLFGEISTAIDGWDISRKGRGKAPTSMG